MTNARTLTSALGGKWHGGYGTAPCPVCQPERRKDQCGLSLRDRADGGGLLAHCHKSGCDFRGILAAAGLAPGTFSAPDATAQREAEQKRRAEAERRAAQAARLWQEAQSNAGTLVERYLRNRGITCMLPPTLRFHPNCWHGPSAKKLPAMVSAVSIGRKVVGIHRTFLAEPGIKAFDNAKLMLGCFAGGAVRLSGGPGTLVVAEGIETGLSLLSGLQDRQPRVWASLGTSGMAGLILPATPHELVIAPDGDAPGRTAANKLADRAASTGWRVRVMDCPDGRDWNNMNSGVAA